MKKTGLLFVGIVLWFLGNTQESYGTDQHNITVKWAPTGLALGSASLQAEYNFGSRNSLTAKIGLPVPVKHSLTYDAKKVGFEMKALSFLAGYRTYFSKKHMRGFYYEPFFKYVHQTSEGEGTGSLDGRQALFNFMNNYNGAGVGIQLGTQFLVGKRFVIDVFLIGPEINSASNSFKALDISTTGPWTEMDAAAAAHNVRTFVNKFPFIRNGTTVMADKETRMVTADFKGALPGVRTGFSIGVAF